MTDFVLVHGAFADSHAFDAVRPRLEARGHGVTTPDLPGHGADTTPLASIDLEAYVASVAATVASRPTPVALVGHSMAGMVVAQVAERLPDRVRRLVFVAAYLPRPGQSLEELAQGDPTSLVGQNMVFADDWSTVTIRPEAVVDALAADLAPELQRLVREAQRPEPLAPFRGKVDLTAARFGSVPRSYLHTGRDRAVTPALQTTMVAAWPGTTTATLDTSHLPFLAAPDAFVDTLLAFVEGDTP